MRAWGAGGFCSSEAPPGTLFPLIYHHFSRSQMLAAAWELRRGGGARDGHGILGTGQCFVLLVQGSVLCCWSVLWARVRAMVMMASLAEPTVPLVCPSSAKRSHVSAPGAIPSAGTMHVGLAELSRTLHWEHLELKTRGVSEKATF